MSSRTTNLNLVKPSSDENVSLPVINSNYDTIDTEVASRVKTSDIQNNLTSTATNKPLSAAQGKALNDAKVNISDIQNNLTSTATDKPLSAAQGKSLSDTKVNVLTKDTISVNLDTTEEIFQYVNASSSTGTKPTSTNGFLFTLSREQGQTKYQEYIPNLAGDNTTVYVRNMSGGTWSTWHTLAKGIIKQLYSGSASDLTGATKYNLSDAYTNYSHLLIVCVTNNERVSQLMPVALITGNHGTNFAYLNSNQTGQQPITSWTYCCWCNVQFPTATTFQNVGGYTTQNLTMKVGAIYGLNL